MKKACAIENHSIHQFKIAITSLWTSSSIYGPSTVPDSRLFISMSMLRKTNIHVIKVPDSTRRPGIVRAPSVRPGSSTDAVRTTVLESSHLNFQWVFDMRFRCDFMSKTFFFYQKSSFLCFMSRDTRTLHLVLERRLWWQLDSNQRPSTSLARTLPLSH